jgi:hypothetical protein
MYNPGMRRLALALLLLAPLSPAFAGKLDLNIYASTPRPKDAAPADGALPWGEHWRPGNPRDLRGESRGIQYLSHIGYAGMGIAGLVGCAATGAVAPAIGFGLVTLIHAWQTWQLSRTPDQRGT